MRKTPNLGKSIKLVFNGLSVCIQRKCAHAFAMMLSFFSRTTSDFRTGKMLIIFIDKLEIKKSLSSQL